MNRAIEARLTMFVLLGFYFFLILDTLGTVMTADRVIAYMLITIVAVILIGALGVGVRPRPMILIIYVAAVLQAFTMGTMMILHWRNLDTIVWLNAFLVVALLYVARGFRAAAAEEPHPLRRHDDPRE